MSFTSIAQNRLHTVRLVNTKSRVIRCTERNGRVSCKNIIKTMVEAKKKFIYILDVVKTQKRLS